MSIANHKRIMANHRAVTVAEEVRGIIRQETEEKYAKRDKERIGMTKKEAATVAIAGNTFSVREELRQLGGRWDPAAKAWNIPRENAKKARALVDSAPAPSWPNRYPRACTSCGTHVPAWRGTSHKVGDTWETRCVDCKVAPVRKTMSRRVK